MVQRDNLRENVWKDVARNARCFMVHMLPVLKPSWYFTAPEYGRRLLFWEKGQMPVHLWAWPK